LWGLFGNFWKVSSSIEITVECYLKITFARKCDNNLHVRWICFPVSGFFRMSNTTQTVKNQDTLLLPITSPNIDRLSKFFTVGLSSDCVTNWSLKIPPHLKYIATLPCETLVFKNWYKYHVNYTSCSLSVVSL